MDLAVFKEWRATGSVSLRNQLVVDNVRIVHSVVRGFAPGEDYDDLVQDGTIGLIRALERFIPEDGAFYQFAKFHIRYAVQESIRLKHGVSTSRNKLTKEEAAECLYGHLGIVHDTRSADMSFHSADLRQDIDANVNGGFEGAEVQQNNERFEARRTIRRAVRDLTDPEISALLAYQSNAPIDVIAKHLGCDWTTTREQVLEQVEALKSRAQASINSSRKRTCYRCMKHYVKHCPHQ